MNLLGSCLDHQNLPDTKGKHLNTYFILTVADFWHFQRCNFGTCIFDSLWGWIRKAFLFPTFFWGVKKTKLAISLISIFLAGISTISTVCQVLVDNLFWDYKRFPLLPLLKCDSKLHKIPSQFSRKRDCRCSFENVGIIECMLQG